MRLWSIHPKYLDVKGLVALWREGLLAKKVLENRTSGYRHHPQLIRFKDCSKPILYINAYLHLVCDEADKRGYKFDRSKLGKERARLGYIYVNSKQIEFEWNHLKGKLKIRSIDKYMEYQSLQRPRVHPLFKKIPGDIEEWEIV